MSVVDDSFDHPLKLEEKATAPLAGGILQYGYQCGMLWGATLAAGAEAYGRYGPGPQAETKAIVAAQRIVKSFRDSNKSINCIDITDLDWTSPSPKQVTGFIIKGGPIKCFRMAANYAPVAFDEINTAFSEVHDEAPSPPVSCASVLAKKMGASDMHTVMAAGFAGGIGLSGGACGALGAAIWLLGMENISEGGKKMDFNFPQATDAVDRFVECSDCEFECSAIVGRTFADVGEHADYVGDGGCMQIIEALAAD